MVTYYYFIEYQVPVIYLFGYYKKILESNIRKTACSRVVLLASLASTVVGSTL